MSSEGDINTGENTNVVSTDEMDNNRAAGRELPKYYGNMNEKLSLGDALEQYESLIFKDTISPRKSIKEYKNELNVSSVSEVSDLLFKSSLNIKDEELKVIGLLALSPSNVSHLPPTEKDGVVGLSILSNALSYLGFTVVIMTDSINQPVVSSLLDNKEHFKNYVDINQEIGFPPNNFVLEKSKIYVIGVVPRPGIDSEWEEFLDSTYSKFSVLISLGRPSKDEQTGIYRNSRGLRINHYCSDLEDVFIETVTKDIIPTIALSDSYENQLGIYRKSDERRKHNARYVLLSHKIDWICYFLTASIALRVSNNFKESNSNDGNTVNDINKKVLVELYLTIFPKEDTFIYLNEKVKELQIWDTLFGEGLIKGFTLENDWEIRMKIRRIANQFGIPIEFNNV